ncbi:1-acyl-sn-glycerol-3-phosphate acyltransferase [Halosquirtibacter laminarini]|uniref:1-acyl-sn-glycerol-3-phosphate acyltransferase n=1 Tax=Halosquirtibacter laminarini TaxID=3374600 RepID=A0AC61NMM6_9BACT|nr:1-acyl-sn-glycerol-3-phosphate acyltransferase [Prolixibacteraceae bacterium]
MRRTFCKFLIRILGWKVVGSKVEDKKCIIVGAPHTSLWDFVICWIGYTSMGPSPNVMIRSEFFKFPLGIIIKPMGALPLNREKGSNSLKQIVRTFQQRETMRLAITPEGTRKKTTKWKGGFHAISRLAKVPVYIGYFDFKRKEMRFDIPFETTSNVEEDLERLKKWYHDKGVVGCHPEQFVTGYE